MDETENFFTFFAVSAERLSKEKASAFDGSDAFFYAGCRLVALAGLFHLRNVEFDFLEHLIHVVQMFIDDLNNG